MSLPFISRSRRLSKEVASSASSINMSVCQRPGNRAGAFVSVYGPAVLLLSEFVTHSAIVAMWAPGDKLAGLAGEVVAYLSDHSRLADHEDTPGPRRAMMRDPCGTGWAGQTSLRSPYEELAVLVHWQRPGERQPAAGRQPCLRGSAQHRGREPCVLLKSRHSRSPCLRSSMEALNGSFLGSPRSSFSKAIKSRFSRVEI